jgi:Flp pilus assembly protein TadG
VARAACWQAARDRVRVAAARRPAPFTAGLTSSSAAWRTGREVGSSAIELAILAPLLLAMIWMTIQYALYYQGRQVALAAAQLGVRYASQHETSQPDWRIAAQLKSENYYQGLGTRVLGPHITANAYISGPGQVRVTVTGSAASILLGLNLTIHETAGAPIECFRSFANGGQNC